MLPQNVVYAIHVLIYLHTPSVTHRSGFLRQELEHLRGMNGVVAIRVLRRLQDGGYIVKNSMSRYRACRKATQVTVCDIMELFECVPLYSSREMNFCPMLGGNSAVDEFFGLMNDNLCNMCSTVTIFDLQMSQIMLSESWKNQYRLAMNGNIHLQLIENKWYALERSAYYFASLFKSEHPGKESNISVVAACKLVNCNCRTYYILRDKKWTDDQFLKHRKTNKV